MTPIYVAIALILVFLVFVYNGFIALINRTKQAWADIDVQLKRRADLVPNLVEVVKGYAKFEKSVLTDVTKARTEMLSAKTMSDKAKADNMLTESLKTLFAVAENYPALKAGDNFVALQGQLAEIEDHLQSARRYYNGNVRDLNTKIETFPYNLIAKAFNFSQREFFEVASASEREPVKVSF